MEPLACKTYRRAASVLALALLALPLCAQGTLLLTEDQPTYTLDAHLAWLDDLSHDLTVKDITYPPNARRFKPAIEARPTAGYSDAARWVRLTLRSTGPPSQTWLLEVFSKSLDRMSLYRPAGPDSFVVIYSGEALPFHNRPYRHRNFVFPLEGIGPLPETLYLRYTSAGPMNLPPFRLWTLEAFAEKDHHAQFILGGYFGILFVVALYNLLLYFSIRDVSFLYYVCYVGSLLLYQLSVERVAFEYFWPYAAWWASRSNNVLVLVTLVSAIQFTRTFLETDTYAAPMDRLLRLLMGVAPVLLLLNLLLQVTPWLNQVMLVYAALVAVVLFVAGVLTFRRGNRVARYYMIAWTALLAGALFRSIGLAASLPQHWSAYALQVGSVMEVILLSLGLGYRYASMRRARERLRLRIAADLHDDLGSGLTQIALYSELLRQQATPQGITWAQQIGQTARTLTGTMQDIVWAIKPTEDIWDSLELRMKDHATQLLTPHQIRLDMQGTVEYQHRRFPIDTRQNVLLMFKEILHNAVKYARCQRVKVRWRVARRSLWLEVSDDGEGFDPSAAAGQGNGLGNLNHRAEQIGATLTLDAAPGAGTRITIEAPL